MGCPYCKKDEIDDPLLNENEFMDTFKKNTISEAFLINAENFGLIEDMKNFVYSEIRRNIRKALAYVKENGWENLERNKMLKNKWGIKETT